MEGYDIHTSTFRDYFNNLIFILNQIIKVTYAMYIAMVSQSLPKCGLKL